MTIREVQRHLKTLFGSSAATASEADDLTRIILEDIAGYGPTFIFANGDRTVEDFMYDKIEAAARRVLSGEPVQYVVGSAHFMGMRLKVTPDTLIPRPETAGLVDIVTDAYGGRSDLQVLDVGTGSGCIAIALARALPFARVTGLDISPAALAVAAENGRAMGVNVAWEQGDALNMDKDSRRWDVVVSNPPYIARSEAASMDARVLDYEPATALFVPDDDPLRFYTAITRYAATHLRDGGGLFFEINPLYADDMRRMMESTPGMTDVDIIRDYRGMLRFAKAVCRGAER